MLVDGVACHDEAMAALSTTSFDLLLVDRALPDGEGLSPCEALRRPDGPGRQRSC
jgi:DNA-binding response OmpR family regulator